MLALISALLAGLYIFLWAGLPIAMISVICGYSAFVAYAFIRSRMWMKDPANMSSLEAGHQPSRAIRIERIFASILIPPIFACVVYALLSLLVRS